MTRHTIHRIASPIIVLLFVVLSALLGACTTGLKVRSWVDERTAVAVTAQQQAWAFFRKDLQAGINVYDYTDLGAFEINQSGKRHQYLCLLEWSAVTRATENRSRIPEDFSTLIVWADDQPLTFKRYTQDHEMLLLGEVAFKRLASTAIESYYEVSLSQLETIAAAKTLRIAAANQAADEPPYQIWRDEHVSFDAFTNEIVSTAKKMNSGGK